MSSDHNASSGDWSHLVSFVKHVIELRSGWSFGHLNQVDVRSDHKTYKVEWSDNESGAMLTLYDDGVWVYESDNGCNEGKVLPLHNNKWARAMVKEGIHHGFAVGGTFYFKALLGKV